MAVLTNRNIAENVFLAQEVVHTFAGTKKKNGFLGLKLDFQRAYDRMEWPFLVQVLNKFGLPTLYQAYISMYFHCEIYNSVEWWSGVQNHSNLPISSLLEVKSWLG